VHAQTLLWLQTSVDAALLINYIALYLLENGNWQCWQWWRNSATLRGETYVHISHWKTEPIRDNWSGPALCECECVLRVGLCGVGFLERNPANGSSLMCSFRLLQPPLLLPMLSVIAGGYTLLFRPAWGVQQVVA